MRLIHTCGATMTVSLTGALNLCQSVFNSDNNHLVHDGSPLKGERIPVVRLDRLLAGREIDFIKIDVQGWELEVFRGLVGSLQANPAVKIYFEFWPFGLRAAGHEPSELFEFLHNLSFGVWLSSERGLEPVLDGGHLTRSLRRRQFVNLLATRFFEDDEV